MLLISQTLIDCFLPVRKIGKFSKTKTVKVKAKFHYASWFGAGSKLVADRFEASKQLA